MAIIEGGEWFECDHEGCESKIKNHHWGYVKAERWFFQKDGRGFCPSHVPPWVTEWRAKRRGLKRTKSPKTGLVTTKTPIFAKEYRLYLTPTRKNWYYSINM